MGDVLRLLPEPDIAGDYGWEDGSVVWYDGPGWRWESGEAYSEDGYVTAVEAALAMANVCPGCGPSRLAVAYHYHPPQTAAEAMAWAVLAGDRSAAWALADEVREDCTRPTGAKTVAERVAELGAENARLREGLQRVATAVTADGWAGSVIRRVLAEVMTEGAK